MRFFRPKAIPLVVQLLHLQRRLTGSGEIRRSRLVWTQSIQPHLSGDRVNKATQGRGKQGHFSRAGCRYWLGFLEQAETGAAPVEEV